MEKKIIGLGVLLLLMCSFAFASITDYKVPDQVHLNQSVTATGKSLNDSNVPQVNELCSFVFFDTNGNLVTRATDQYTDQTGRFTMPPFYVNEPEFLRDSNYTLKSICGSNEADQNFEVIQRQSIAHLGVQEFGYILDEENIGTAFIWFIMLMIFALVFSGGYVLWKRGGK